MASPTIGVPVAKFDLLRQVMAMTGQKYLTADQKDAVFVCVDCEAFEHDQSKVTELGVAVLDSKDTLETKPGASGEEWVAKISYAHYRPVEYWNNVNRRFVKGREDQFAFGNTTWINLSDAGKLLSRIFQCPERLSDAADFEKELPDTKRDIIFVAHGLSNDDAYLTQLGFKLSQTRNVFRQVDSQRMAGGTKKNSIGLKSLLEKLGMQYQGLHNGGNDAAYTLQALVVMAVKEYQQPGVIYGPNKLPATTLPGAVRASGVSAPHVYGGTAVQGKETLPISGRKIKPLPKNAFGKRKMAAQPARSFSMSDLPNLGRHTLKRAAPVDDGADEQPVRKKQAR